VQTWLPVIITALVSVLASSGFWAWIQSRDTTRTATSKLLMGLAYDKLVMLGLQYIEQGSITRDEMEDFREYLIAYKALGGNGVAERISEDVMHLPMRNHNRYSEIARPRSNVGENNGN
jgi:hypothetical protein